MPPKKTKGHDILDDQVAKVSNYFPYLPTKDGDINLYH